MHTIMDRFVASVVFTALTACRAHGLPSQEQGDAAVDAGTPQLTQLLLVKIVILQDKSGSAPSTRTPQLTFAEIEPLIEKVSVHSEFDLGVGLINSRSDQSLTRIRLAPPPERPAPVRERVPSNPFDRLYAKHTPQDAGAFESVLGEWQEHRVRQLESFRTAASHLLEAPTRGCTDVEGALARADMMLAEPEARFTSDRLHLWAIFVTDGLQTIERHPATLRSNARVVIVNSGGTTGAIERLHPLRFESPTRAIQYVIEQETNPGGNATTVTP